MSTAAADDLARRCAAHLFGQDAASRSLGIAIEEIRAGYARLSMTLTETMLNGYAIAHGGMLFALADTAFAVACNSYDQMTVAAGCDISFLQPGRAGDRLTAEAVERSRVGRSGLYDVTVRRSDGAVLAEMRGRSRTVAGAVLTSG